MDSKISIKPPLIVSIVMLLMALAPLPYGYFTLLRIVICLTAVFLAWFSAKLRKTFWLWIMGFIALIFNPIVPLYLGRPLWLVVDLVVALTFAIYLIKNSKVSK